MQPTLSQALIEAGDGNAMNAIAMMCLYTIEHMTDADLYALLGGVSALTGGQSQESFQPSRQALAPQHSVSVLHWNDKAWGWQSLQLLAICCQLVGRDHRLLQLSQDPMHCRILESRLQYLEDTTIQQVANERDT